mgnify:CR=1 FL=1
MGRRRWQEARGGARGRSGARCGGRRAIHAGQAPMPAAWGVFSASASTTADGSDSTLETEADGLVAKWTTALGRREEQVAAAESIEALVRDSCTRRARIEASAELRRWRWLRLD